MNDIELIQASKRGDIDAFTCLVKRYEADIRSCLAVRLNNVSHADDLAQETFIIAFRKIDEFDETMSVRPWLKGIAINFLRNHWRKYEREVLSESQELEKLINDAIDEEYAEDDRDTYLLRALQSCMKKMNNKVIDILNLHYYKGVSVKELTKHFDVKHSAMTMRLHRIREQLKKCIHNEAGEAYD